MREQRNFGMREALRNARVRELDALVLAAAPVLIVACVNTPASGRTGRARASRAARRAISR